MANSVAEQTDQPLVIGVASRTSEAEKAEKNESLPPGERVEAVYSDWDRARLGDWFAAWLWIGCAGYMVYLHCYDTIQVLFVP
ncbi:MAG: hypothetical protein KatS3mg105_1363 [Gemmatales bacterium]|nr:MAG: hypothetical protein KatS3mg105_1363 [Gemmatales bacterium]